MENEYQQRKSSNCNRLYLFHRLIWACTMCMPWIWICTTLTYTYDCTPVLLITNNLLRLFAAPAFSTQYVWSRNETDDLQNSQVSDNWCRCLLWDIIHSPQHLRQPYQTRIPEIVHSLWRRFSLTCIVARNQPRRLDHKMAARVEVGYLVHETWIHHPNDSRRKRNPNLASCIED